MKVLILSPFFPPQVNGLAHYTYCFAKALSDRGEEVTVLCNEGLGCDSDIKTKGMKSWGISAFLGLFFSLKSKDFDKILIQYVPHMYNRKGGINFSLPFFVLLTRIFTSIKIDIMFHELHYPLEAKPLSIFLWSVHHLMLIPMVWFSHCRFFSTQRYFQKAKNFSLDNRFYFLPVGSNIPRSSAERSIRTGDEAVSLCFFAGVHPSKNFSFVFEGLKKSHKNFHLHFFGVTESSFKESYGNDYESFDYTFYGTLSDEQISSLLRRMDYLVAYFTDGISSRRGSVLAALNNGVPVISTRSLFTEELFNDFPGVVLFSLGDDFSRELCSYFDQFHGNVFDSSQITDGFDQTFSWKVISEKFLKSCPF